MKKALSILLLLCITAVNSYSLVFAAESGDLAYNFDSYSAEIGSNTPPSGWYVRDGGVSGGDTVYSVATERGISFGTTVYSATRQVQYSTNSGISNASVYSLEASILRKDLKSDFYFCMRDSNAAVNGVLFKKDGSVSVYGKSVPDFKYITGEWIDFKLTIKKTSGEFGFQIFQGDNVGELYSNGASTADISYLRIYYLAGTYTGGSTTLLDDIRLYKSNSFENPKEGASSGEVQNTLLFDFEGFEPNEKMSSPPATFNQSSLSEGNSGYTVVDNNGGKAVRIFAKNDNQIRLVKLVNAYKGWGESNTIEADVRPGSGVFNRYIIDLRVKQDDVVSMVDLVKFGNDEKIYIGSDTDGVPYNTDEWYHVCLKLAAEDNKIKSGSVKCSISQGETVLAEDVAIDNEKLNGVSLGDNNTQLNFGIIKTADQNECNFDLDNLKFDEQKTPVIDTEEQRKTFSYLASRPTNERNWVFLNEKVRLIFNKAIDDDFSNVWTINGEPVDESRISLLSENSRIAEVDLSGLLDAGEQYTLAWTNLKDTFGKKVSGNIAFDTAENAVRISEPSPVLKAENTYGFTLGGVAYSGENESIFALAVSFDEETGKMQLPISAYERSLGSTYETTEETFSVPDANSITELYYWYGLFGTNTAVKDITEVQNTMPPAEEYTGDADLKAAVDYDTGAMTVYAKGGAEYAIIAVLKPNHTVYELMTGTIEQRCNALEYVRQVKCINGGFGISFPLDGYGKRTILIDKCDANGITEYSDAVNYLSEQERIELLNAFNDPKADIASLISDAFSSIGLDETLYNSLSEAGKATVHNAIKNEAPYADIPALCRTFKETAILCLLKESSNFFETVSKYEDVWNIKKAAAYQTYLTYEDSISSLVSERMLAGNYSSISEAEKSFNDIIILSALEKANVYTESSAIISNNAEYLGWDFTELEKLRTTKPVFEAVTRKKFDDMTALKNAFDNAVSQQKNIESQTTTTSGGGGGSGGRDMKISIGTGAVNNSESNENNSQSVFSDIGGVPWAHEAIAKMTEEGIINGKEDNRFVPFDNITREEFTKLLVEAFLKDNNTERNVGTFKDVSDDAWYAKYIYSATAAGIVQGYGDNFGVGNEITRQDMALMCVRTAAYIDIAFDNSSNETIEDAENISDYAREAVFKLKATGIMTGDDDNMFRPLDNANRAEAAKVVYEMMKRRK